MLRGFCWGLTETWSRQCQSQHYLHSASSFLSQTIERQNIKDNKKVIYKIILDSYNLCLQSEQVNFWASNSNTSKQPCLQNQWICFTVWDNHIFTPFHPFYEGNGRKVLTWDTACSVFINLISRVKRNKQI